MEGTIRSVYLSTNELTSSVFDYFQQIKKDITVDQMETLLSNLLLDTFGLDSTQGHLDNTLSVLYSFNIFDDHAYYIASTINNQLLFLIDSTRMSDNLNYLDKITIELVSPYFIKITYDPEKKIFSSYSF